MPAWPDLTSSIKPMRSTGARPVPRTSRAAMQALQQWHIWSRTGGKQSRPILIVAELVDSLPQRERQVIDAWMAGSLDRDTAQRLTIPIEFVARVRFDTLTEVGVRLAQRPARASVIDDWHIGPFESSSAL